LLVKIAREYGADLYGPTRADYHWQSQAGRGFDAGSFRIDWDKQEATCPEGKTSLSWTPAVDSGDNEVIKIKFSRIDCKPCLSRSLCTTAKHLRRTVTIRTQEAYEALHAARQRQQSEGFKGQYKKRAGVEGTISQAIRALGMRRSRYMCLAETPRAAMRKSHFERLITLSQPA
jgi:Transposase DDE domain